MQLTLVVPVAGSPHWKRSLEVSRVQRIGDFSLAVHDQSAEAEIQRLVLQSPNAKGVPLGVVVFHMTLDGIRYLHCRIVGRGVGGLRIQYEREEDDMPEDADE